MYSHWNWDFPIVFVNKGKMKSRQKQYLKIERGIVLAMWILINIIFNKIRYFYYYLNDNTFYFPIVSISLLWGWSMNWFRSDNRWMRLSKLELHLLLSTCLKIVSESEAKTFFNKFSNFSMIDLTRNNYPTHLFVHQTLNKQIINLSFNITLFK